MLFRMAAIAALSFCAATVQAASDDQKVLSLDTLVAGQSFEITTADRVLRCELIQPATGEALVNGSWDGKHFGPQRRVFLLGATQGQQPESGGLTLILMHEVREGMRLELGMGSLDQRDRRVTTPVRSFKLLPNNDSVAAL